MSCDCFFCEENRFSLNRSVGLPGEDSIIYEDDYIYITPDIAPLVLGHFLIVTKRHHCCCGSVDDSVFESLEKAKDFLKECVFKKPQVMFFEHGSVIEHTAGSCIDHAHIHALPYDKQFNFDHYLKHTGFIKTEKSRADKNALKNCAVKQQPYIYCETNRSERWYYPVGHLPSQFFRMMVAGTKNYNWTLLYKTTKSQSLFRQTLAYAKKECPDVLQTNDLNNGLLVTGK